MMRLYLVTWYVSYVSQPYAYFHSWCLYAVYLPDLIAFIEDIIAQSKLKDLNDSNLSWGAEHLML